MNLNSDSDAVPTGWGCSPELAFASVVDLMLELEQRLRIARLRIAIEGEQVMADVSEGLAGLTALVHEKLS